MTGQHLHDFDLRLCDCVLGNIAQRMARPRFAAQVAQALATRPLLLDHLKRAADLSLDAEQPRLLLNDSELNSLKNAVEVAVHLIWEPDPELHRRFVATLKEVRDNLSGHAAEDWSEWCVQFREDLEVERLPLADGIDLIHQWVRRLRTLLRAMGAVELLPAPEGRSPTPTHHTPTLAAPATQSTELVAPMPPAEPVHSTGQFAGLAGMISQFTEAVNKISVPAATQPPPPEALSKQDAAKFLGVSVKTIEHLIRVRKIQYVQLGSQRGRVIPIEALRKLLQDNVQLTAQEELRRRARR